MSTTTPTTPAPQTASGINDPTRRPAGMPFGTEDPKRRQKLLIGGVAGVALVVALAAVFVFRPWRPATPRLNDEPAKIAQLASGPDFEKLPFARRELYMKMLDTKKAQLAQAYAGGQLSDLDYRKSLEMAHLGKRLDEMRKYFSRPEGAERVAYLDKILAKKEAKEETIKHNPAAKQDKKERDLFRDTALRETEVNTWPAEVQSQFKEFTLALDARKKFHKAANTPATRPAD
ncbi:MAG: hypothetical protein JWO87_765 [Phycisphaerales bacterium]|nr:hypothetical protein [Phycisphaerales bacterium]